MTTTADRNHEGLSTRTLRTYAADWALFTDWCRVTGHRELPADPDTVIAFLADCPAAPKTHRGRVAAIDHHHTAAGHPPPGRSRAARAALGRPTGDPFEPSVDTVAAVQTALRALPSHGWTQGMFGRRDRCLLVLTQLAGVPYQHLATLTAGGVSITDGTAVIRGAAGGWMVAPDDNPVFCGPCAITRWVRVLDVAVTRPSSRKLARALAKAKPTTDESPHLCRSIRGLDEATRATPLLLPIDQWGYVPLPLRRLTPHSLSRRVRELLAGELGAHRHLPVEPDEEPEAPVPVTAPASRAVYSRDDWRRGWARRRADLALMADIDDVLTDVDNRVADLNRRTSAFLAAGADQAD